MKLNKSYTRARIGNDRKWLLKEAARLRKTGQYNAKVLKSNVSVLHHGNYTLWTRLIRL